MTPCPIFTHRQIKGISILLPIKISVSIWFTGKFESVWFKHFLKWKKIFLHEQFLLDGILPADSTFKPVLSFSDCKIFQSKRLCPILTASLPTIYQNMRQSCAAIRPQFFQKRSEITVKMSLYPHTGQFIALQTYSGLSRSRNHLTVCGITQTSICCSRSFLRQNLYS